LDAGCGTGGNLELLQKLGFKKLSGFDIEKEAVEYCHQKGLKTVQIADINRIPYA
jgi:SAM-dependent methyltransferase